MTSTLDMRETAKAIGMSVDWFRRARVDLQTRKGFPAPLPLPLARPTAVTPRRGRPKLVWSREAVEAWVRASGKAGGADD